MIEALHTGMMANACVGGEVSELFSVTNGVKQGCVLTPRSSPSSYQQWPTRLSETWAMASTNNPDSGDLFNVAHFRAKTKTTRILTRELLFADDSALVAHSAEEMQKIVDAFSDASKKFGLKINIKKTEVLYQPNSTRTREEDIMVDGNTYLGSTISRWYILGSITNIFSPRATSRATCKHSHVYLGDTGCPRGHMVFTNS